jgi:hypothetical protein
VRLTPFVDKLSEVAVVSDHDSSFLVSDGKYSLVWQPRGLSFRDVERVMPTRVQIANKAHVCALIDDELHLRRGLCTTWLWARIALNVVMPVCQARLDVFYRQVRKS